MEASFKEQVIEILDEIIGNGSFAVSGIRDFVSPGLKIKGMDEIGFPASSKQIIEMIKAAHKAPYGKGSQTILDTRVRSAWEIDAQDMTLLNPSWNKQLENILNEVKKGLDLELRTVSATLYKMLIYEQGDFFLPHKDSEKEPGMFGTLIIGLPSKHTGGPLLIRFDGKESNIHFSDANAYEMPFAAFYADCEHEIQPITSGYRICLVYNLVQKTDDFKIQVFENQDLVNDLVPVLETADREQPMVILL
jgi:hypothetical protein